MNLVARYIAAIKFWLPGDLKDDIGAELAEDIRSEIEEREREKGRKLSDDEIADLLKARGAPLTVASRYLPQRQLIGPEIFPVYLLVLEIVAAICIIPAALAWLGAVIAGPAHVPVHFLTSPIESLVTSFGIVTLVFAAIEYKGIPIAKSSNWNPRRLPDVRLPKISIKRADLVGDITSSLVLVWLFFAGFLSKTEYDAFGWHIVLTPIWIAYWQIVLAVTLAETIFAAALLFRPVWTGPAILLRLGLDITKIGLLGWLLSSDVLRGLSVDRLNPADAARLVDASHQLAHYALPLALCLTACVVLAAVVRFTRLLRGPAPVDV